ncbi:hypothetical protein GL218_00753 [Daldinia childiae]|uniref:uncharacterized protein n=1 Tax=Daldinia childiae TaxID=326645 RepID=UPI0014479DCF|nr:uncharacterized protein GL218_00753 [Daldinia childiae]KAF3070982.1 hypothetical protein GL218_00753 [Daldinia childiae]
MVHAQPRQRTSPPLRPLHPRPHHGPSPRHLQHISQGAPDQAREPARGRSLRGAHGHTSAHARRPPASSRLAHPEPQIPLLGRAVLKVGRGLTRCADRVRGWRDGLVRTKEQVKQDYARVAFAAERKYWLALTAYRQSPWPNTLRQLWYLLLMVGLVLVVWVGLVKVLAVMEERERQQAHIRAIPMYGVWSVTPLRCPCVGQNE